MSTSLVPCTGCARHVRASDAACPFCGLVRTLEASRDAVPGARPLSRAALLFAAAATVASTEACGKTDPPLDAAVSEPPMPVAVYGPAPIDDVTPVPDLPDAGGAASDAGKAAADAGKRPDAGKPSKM